jgi:carboxymethylenebutenolidase
MEFPNLDTSLRVKPQRLEQETPSRVAAAWSEMQVPYDGTMVALIEPTNYFLEIAPTKTARCRKAVRMKEEQRTDAGLTPAQQLLSDLWDEHVRDEFLTKDTVATLETMVPDAYVNHIPVLTGGKGRDQLSEFYSKHFIPKMPPDTEITPISRTIGSERLVEELIVRFTHSIEMDWMLPGIPHTGKRVECAVVAIVQFRDNKLYNEHIYWDQASVLVQLGLLDSSKLPIAGVETVRKLTNPGLPSNRLIERARDSRKP